MPTPKGLYQDPTVQTEEGYVAWRVPWSSEPALVPSSMSSDKQLETIMSWAPKEQRPGVPQPLSSTSAPPVQVSKVRDLALEAKQHARMAPADIGAMALGIPAAAISSKLLAKPAASMAGMFFKQYLPGLALRMGAAGVGGAAAEAIVASPEDRGSRALAGGVLQAGAEPLSDAVMLPSRLLGMRNNFLREALADPANMEAVEFAKKIGRPLNIAEISKSPMLMRLSAKKRGSLFGGSSARERIEGDFEMVKAGIERMYTGVADKTNRDLSLLAPEMKASFGKMDRENYAILATMLPRDNPQLTVDLSDLATIAKEWEERDRHLIREGSEEKTGTPAMHQLARYFHFEKERKTMAPKAHPTYKDPVVLNPAGEEMVNFWKMDDAQAEKELVERVIKYNQHANANKKVPLADAIALMAHFSNVGKAASETDYAGLAARYSGAIHEKIMASGSALSPDARDVLDAAKKFSNHKRAITKGVFDRLVEDNPERAWELIDFHDVDTAKNLREAILGPAQVTSGRATLAMPLERQALADRNTQWNNVIQSVMERRVLDPDGRGVIDPMAIHRRVRKLDGTAALRESVLSTPEGREKWANLKRFVDRFERMGVKTEERYGDISIAPESLDVGMGILTGAAVATARPLLGASLIAARASPAIFATILSDKQVTEEMAKALSKPATQAVPSVISIFRRLRSATKGKEANIWRGIHAAYSLAMDEAERDRTAQAPAPSPLPPPQARPAIAPGQ